MSYTVNLRLLTYLGNQKIFNEGINLTITESTLQKAMFNAIENAGRVFAHYTNRPETLTFEAVGTTEEGNLEKIKAIINYNTNPETIEILSVAGNQAIPNSTQLPTLTSKPNYHSSTGQPATHQHQP